MLLRIITASGAEHQLNVQKVIAIDGIPFSMMEPVDLQNLHTRLTIIETAFAGFMEDWQMLMETAKIIPDEEPQTKEQDDGSRQPDSSLRSGD